MSGSVQKIYRWRVFLGCGVALITATILLMAQPADAVNRTTLPDPTQNIEEGARGRQTVVFAGGCFWGVEAVFRHTQGVVSAVSGYAGGNTAQPTYEQVSSGLTGHAESVQVIYDPAKISYGQLLKIYFSVAHDPTQLNYQGPDHGTQYRSAIFTTNDQQARMARAYIAQLQAAKAFQQAIVTQVNPLSVFYPAEDYHQNYLALHPDQAYIVHNDLPKLENLRAQFPALYH